MKKAAAIFVLLSTLLFAGCGAAAEKPGEKGGEAENSKSVITDFTTKDLNGNEFKLGIPDEGYDLIMLNIWATYCGACKKEMPDLSALSKKLPERVLLLGLCIDGQLQSESAKRIVEDAGGGYTTLLPSENYNGILDQISYIPTTVFLNSKGELVGDMHVGIPQGDTVEGYLAMINSRLEKLKK